MKLSTESRHLGIAAVSCHLISMTDKPTPKRPRDANQLAKSIVDIATGEAAEPIELSPTKAKASKAGASGGPARAKALSPERRAEIASIAAQARWKKD